MNLVGGLIPIINHVDDSDEASDSKKQPALQVVFLNRIVRDLMCSTGRIVYILFLWNEGFPDFATRRYGGISITQIVVSSNLFHKLG